MTEPTLVDDEVAVDFTVEELVVLCERLDLPRPPGLGRSPFEGVPPDLIDAHLSTAHRSLVARRIVDGGGVVEGVARILEIVTEPDVLIYVQHEENGLVLSRTFSAGPGVSVEHRPLVEGVHRLVAFETRELLVNVLLACKLVARPLGEPLRIQIDVGSAMAASDHVARGEGVSAVAILERAGLKRVHARLLVDAIEAKVQAARVVVLHRPSPSVLAGGELSWVDCGDRGIWVVPTPDLSDHADRRDFFGDETTIEIRSITREMIMAELVSYLPAQPRFG